MEIKLTGKNGKDVVLARVEHEETWQEERSVADRRNPGYKGPPTEMVEARGIVGRVAIRVGDEEVILDKDDLLIAAHAIVGRPDDDNLSFEV